MEVEGKSNTGPTLDVRLDDGWWAGKSVVAFGALVVGLHTDSIMRKPLKVSKKVPSYPCFR